MDDSQRLAKTIAEQPAGILQETTAVSSPTATILQFTGLVKVANANRRGDMMLFEAKRASRDYRGGLL